MSYCLAKIFDQFKPGPHISNIPLMLIKIGVDALKNGKSSVPVGAVPLHGKIESNATQVVVITVVPPSFLGNGFEGSGSSAPNLLSALQRVSLAQFFLGLPEVIPTHFFVPLRGGGT